MKQYTIQIFTLLFTGTVLLAQKPVQPQAAQPMDQLQKEYYEATAPGITSVNSSLLPQSAWAEFSRLELGLQGEKGAFHRPQQPADLMNYRFQADGAVRLGDYYLKGAFAFTQAFEQEVKFTSILDPYRGTPYVIADSTGGDWRKQLYDMWFSLASPTYGGHFSYGLRTSLNVGRGAKMIDPRPLSNSNSIEAVPSVTLTFGRHRLGGDFTYRRFVENANIILYNSSEAQKIYLMKGFGQYTYDIFSTTERERRYAGQGFGGGLQYLYQGDKAQLMIEGGAENYTEEASDIEFNRPRQRGRLYETTYTLAVEALLKLDQQQHRLRLGYEDCERSGREIIQIFDSSPTVNAWLTDSEAPRRSEVEKHRLSADYALMLMSDRPMTYRWKFSLFGRIEEFREDYRVMKSYLAFKDATGGVALSRNLWWGQHSWLQPSLTFSYHGVWDESMALVEREVGDRTIADEWVRPDVDYLFQNYMNGEVSLVYGYSFANKSSLSVGGEYGLIRTSDSRYRNLFALKVGYNF